MSEPSVAAFIGDLKPLPEFLPFSPPSTDDQELAELAATLQSGWLTTGPRTERFEKLLAERLGAPTAAALSSCTAALHLGLLALDLGPGQATLTTPLTFPSTAHAAVYVGARPLLCDVSPDTGNLDPEAVRRFLSQDCRPGPDGRPVHQATGLTVTALVPVHYGGHPADLPALWTLAAQHRLNMLEDAAHALGSFLLGLPIGHPALRPAAAQGLTSMTAFSFYATKNLTTAEGGLLVCSDLERLERIRRLSMYGLSDARRIWGRYAPHGTWVYDVAELGFKCNFTDLQAALGLVQLRKLDDFLAARTARAAVWLKALAPMARRGLVELPTQRPDCRSSWHLFPLRLNLKHLKIERDDFIEALKALNIGTSVMFIPIHYHSYYQKTLGYQQGDFPIAEDFFRREVSLPLSPAHSLPTIEAAAALVAALLDRQAR
ncbi:MAG: DegT/DnrJ/EryC1/StrS aminotransferase family protein [Deltaproteobacteria bacterium]|jgi:dTDP-4-amino-4,6-dideoxygalactose transaminase|nr:DegT/DnrJ/EryC1/StrS aminotransferase family protein [Deltaproteobacteria bacterium]